MTFERIGYKHWLHPKNSLDFVLAKQITASHPSYILCKTLTIVLRQGQGRLWRQCHLNNNESNCGNSEQRKHGRKEGGDKWVGWGGRDGPPIMGDGLGSRSGYHCAVLSCSVVSDSL